MVQIVSYYKIKTYYNKDLCFLLSLLEALIEDKMTPSTTFAVSSSVTTFFAYCAGI